MDGLEEGVHPQANELNLKVRQGVERIIEIINSEKIKCRLDMRYQMIAPTQEENNKVVQFLTDQLGYKSNEFYPAQEQDRLKFNGLENAIETNVIGQLNAPEFLDGLVEAIKRLGGDIVERVKYQNTTNQNGKFQVETDNGIFETTSPPIIAGGLPFRRVVSVT
jgi:hypothetical protein